MKEIDYHAEEILGQLGKRDVSKIIEFFGERTRIEKGKPAVDDYEAIPFQFHTLSNDLAKDPELVLSEVREWYDNDYGMFVVRGAKLLANIFPTISLGFQKELCRLIKAGTRDESRMSAARKQPSVSG